MQAPGRERDVLVQIAKGAVAAVIAWQVAKVALHSDQPFLAPLAALIAVEATVYQSLRTTVQNVTAVLAGVLLAFLTARTLGVEWYSLGLVLVVALGMARWQRLGGSGLQVPTTALLAMTIAGGVQDTMLEARVIETLVGALIGATINMLILPPVHLRDGRESVASTARGVSRLLTSIAEGIRTGWSREDAQEWLDRARQLDARVRDARSASERGRESMRFNPRATPDALPVDVASLDRAVDSLEHVAVQCRSIAASLLDTVTGDHTRRPPMRSSTSTPRSSTRWPRLSPPLATTRAVPMRCRTCASRYETAATSGATCGLRPRTPRCSRTTASRRTGRCS